MSSSYVTTPVFVSLFKLLSNTQPYIFYLKSFSCFFNQSPSFARDSFLLLCTMLSLVCVDTSARNIHTVENMNVKLSTT